MEDDTAPILAWPAKPPKSNQLPRNDCSISTKRAVIQSMLDLLTINFCYVGHQVVFPLQAHFRDWYHAEYLDTALAIMFDENGDKGWHPQLDKVDEVVKRLVREKYCHVTDLSACTPPDDVEWRLYDKEHGNDWELKLSFTLAEFQEAVVAEVNSEFEAKVHVHYTWGRRINADVTMPSLADLDLAELQLVEAIFKRDLEAKLIYAKLCATF